MLRSPRRRAAFVVTAAALWWTWPALAQNVSMSGSLGDKALLIIDGTPRTLSVGSVAQGVKLIRVTGDDALVEVAGRRVTLMLGGAQVSLGRAAGEGGSQIVLSASSGGHFRTEGSINGKSVRFVVDTGATTVALSQAEADRLGIDYRNAPRGLAQTANGTVASYRVSLAAVRVGEVTVHDVEATVVPLPMDQVLLGNSFLSRFQMKRDNDVMTLSKRF